MAAPYDVFLSYARADAPRAALVRDKLEALGLNVFFDAEGVDSGEEFPIVIDTAVKGAKCVLGLWSRAALERRWVRIESRIGLDQKKLVAAMIDGTPPQDLPAEFYNVNFESLADFTGVDTHPGWIRIVRAIGRRIGRPDLAREEAPPRPPPPAAKASRAQHNMPWLIGAGLAAIAAVFIVIASQHHTEPKAPITTTTEAPRPDLSLSGFKPVTANISGQWIGEYWGPQATRTTFAAAIESDGASFHGLMRENNTFATGAGPILGATFSGVADQDGALRFRKTYDGTGGVSHSVDYEGRYDAASGVISGTWRVQNNAGEFRMQRR